MSIPNITLSNGFEMPIVGLGTYKVSVCLSLRKKNVRVNDSHS